MSTTEDGKPPKPGRFSPRPRVKSELDLWSPEPRPPMSYWILSDSSLPEGPLNCLAEALAQASELSREFCEPVMVYSGDGIANWDPVDVVFA